MLWLIDRITPVKVDAAGEAAGLDQAIHVEAAYLEALDAPGPRPRDSA